jgi:hypothetical protein
MTQHRVSGPVEIQCNLLDSLVYQYFGQRPYRVQRFTADNPTFFFRLDRDDFNSITASIKSPDTMLYLKKSLLTASRN